MQTSSKALSSYIRDHGVDSREEPFLLPVKGAIQKEKQFLVGSQGFVIATMCLIFMATLAIVVDLLFLDIWRMPALKLGILVHIAREYEATRSSKSRKSDTLLPHLPPTTLGLHDSTHPETNNLLLRLPGFVGLEIAFLSLVLVCSKTPTIVNIPLPLIEVKGGFIVFFILWQGFAIFLLSDAVSYAYSREWSLRRCKSTRLAPGETDCVSRVTSGTVDRIRYFFTQGASATFRIAFATFITLMALNSFAPGTLSVGPVKTTINTTLHIADLARASSPLGDDNVNNFNANTLTLLEYHEGVNFRYDVEPNWIMAWPDEVSIDSDITGVVEYPTDVIRFNYSCAWRKPEMGSDEGSTTWWIDDHAWELWSDLFPDFPYRGGIIPLYRYVDVQPDARLAVVVLGTNDSLPVDSNEDKRSIVDLNNLPTLYHPSGLTLYYESNEVSQWTSPLSTVLYCDPQINSSGGRAQLSPDKALKLSASRLPPVRNIPHDAITTIFASALLEVLDADDYTVHWWLGTQSIQMFLRDTSPNFSKYPSGVPLNDLPTLNDNFNNYTLSASKAFLDGLSANPTNQSDLIKQTRSVIGLGEVKRQGLRGDRTLGIVSLCLSIGSIICYGALVRWLSVNGGEAFILADILHAIRAGKEESSLLLG